METEFTPISALIGGALIGLAAVLMMVSQGRIMGVSGMLGPLLAVSRMEEVQWWRGAFVIGCVVAPVVHVLAGGTWVAITMPAGLPMAIAAGLAVGVGTTIGNGCTSGHGVCGLARFSRRSLVATAIFMTTAALTVFVVRHVLQG